MSVLKRLTIALVLLGLLPAGAQAAKVGIAGGATRLAFNKKTATALRGLGVSIKAIGGAKATTGGAALFPISGGRVDPTTGLGTIEHSGGLEISAGKTKLDLTDFTVNTVSGKLSVSVGYGRINAFKLDADNATFNHAAGAGVIDGVVVKLAKAGAKALNSTFRTDAFKRGTVIGTASVPINPTEAALSSGSTRLVLDPAAASALGSLGVAAGAADGATANADGSVSFPVTGGRLSLEGYDGRILHSGALTLTKGGTTVALSSFGLNTKFNTLSGLVNGAGPAVLLALSEPASTDLAKNGTLSTTDRTASLTAGAADALNQAFGTTAFTKGLVLGYLTTTTPLY